jgi:hypothetical protein
VLPSQRVLLPLWALLPLRVLPSLRVLPPVSLHPPRRHRLPRPVQRPIELIPVPTIAFSLRSTPPDHEVVSHAVSLTDQIHNTYMSRRFHRYESMLPSYAPSLS